ncbi:MAG: hypothetical protein JO202_05640 [Ktedonobacteraceae bacterium]|nr:hypothetical protein [Ktedonobacteraceae bacterium]
MSQRRKKKGEHQATALCITRQEMIALQEVPVVYASVLLTTLPSSLVREMILDTLQNVEKRITALLTQRTSPSEPLVFDLPLDELYALHTALLGYMILAQTHPIMFEHTKTKLLGAFSKRLVTFLAPHFPAVVLN